MTKINYTKVLEYCFNIIDLEPYEETELSPYETVQRFFYYYEKEYGWNIERTKNIQKNIAEWLTKLPSICNVDFTHYKILEVAKEFGSDLSTEKKEQAVLDNWFNFIACNLLKLKNKSETAINKRFEA